MAYSHNGKYYAKRLRKADAAGIKTISSFFVSHSQTTNATEQDVDVEDGKVELVVPGPLVDLDDISPGPLSHIKTIQTNPVRKADKRRFNIDEYKTDFPWLSKTADDNKIVCKTCEFVYKDHDDEVNTSLGLSPFVFGVDSQGSHPTVKFSKHEKSTAHINASDVQARSRVQVLTSSKKSVLAQIRDSSSAQQNLLISRNNDVVKKLFSIVYFIIKNKWAQAKYECFVRFVAKLGVEALALHLKTAPSKATYLSINTATEMIEIIGNDLENEILNSLRKAPGYSLLADESTDESNKTQLAIFCRWYMDRCFKDHYIGLIAVPKTDSASLMEYIRIFLEGKGIPIEKCMFVAFDGTNSMSGCKTGLQKRFRHFSPHSLYVNCRNHRLALCIKHLMKDYPELMEVDEALLSIWKLFKYSPQRFAVFNSVQEVYGQGKLVLIRAATTRWLSHWKASVRFINQFEMILDALDAIYDAKREPEVAGLRMVLTSKRVVAMICCLCDILKPLNELSLYLQGSDVILCNVEAKVKLVVTQLEMLRAAIDNQQLDPSFYTNKLGDLMLTIDHRTDLQRRLRGHVEQLDIADYLRSTIVPLIDALVGEIQNAFHMHPVFDAFRMTLCPDHMPFHAQNTIQLFEYGEAAMKTLCQHYGSPGRDEFQGDVKMCPPFIDTAVTTAEYVGFKHHLNIQHRQRRTNGEEGPITLFEAFEILETDAVLKISFPMMYRLLYVANTIPASTASVERAFSQIVLIKTKQRNRLSQNILDSILRINLEGPEELSERNIENMVLAFKTKKDRYIQL